MREGVEDYVRGWVVIVALGALSEVIDGEEEWEVEMLLGKRQGEELVQVQKYEGGAEDTHPPSTLDEVKEEVGPIRRSARLASKAVVGEGGGRPTSKRKRRRVRQWVTRYEYRQAQERGEEVVGVHYMHTMKEEEGGVTLHSVMVGR
jgi:hypothetical protein